LIPSWKKGASFVEVAADTYNTMNARSESIEQAPSYRHRLDRGRCIVIVDGFYEWKKQNVPGQPKKQPYFFTSSIKPPSFYVENSELKVNSIDDHQKEVPIDDTYDSMDENQRPYLQLAGLYDYWYDKESQTKYASVTILTTNVAQELAWVHDRMPVILTGQDAVRWLDTKNYTFQKCKDLLRPNPAMIKWFPVTESIGNVKFQGINCIKPVDVKSQKIDSKHNIGAFFKPESKPQASEEFESKFEVEKVAKLKPSFKNDDFDNLHKASECVSPQQTNKKRSIYEINSPASADRKRSRIAATSSPTKQNTQPSLNQFLAPKRTTIDLT
jgi:putative SOS response-associated peptidase YedK